MSNWWSQNHKWMIPTITFIIGAISSAIISYFIFVGQITNLENEIDWIKLTYKAEFKNIYDVFHTHYVWIQDLKP